MTGSGTRLEQLAHGKALRRKTPREAHAELKGPLTHDAVDDRKNLGLVTFHNFTKRRLIARLRTLY